MTLRLKLRESAPLVTTRTLLRMPAAIGVLGLTFTLVGCGASAASTDDSAGYPSEPITVLVPYAAGGPSDLTARSISTCLSTKLGQPVVVENKAGGSGALAMQELASAEPDGHTLGLGTSGTLVMNPLVNKLDYSLDDFAPIGVMAENPTVIVVGEDSPYEDGEEFFDAAKDKPGKLTVGVPGATSPAAIELQRLEQEYGIEVVAVPASGNAEMTTNLLGGHVDALFINDHPDVEARIDDGSFLPIAATTPERLEWLPELPTLAELGFPDLVNATSVFGLFGPKELPAKIVTTLESELESCLGNKKVIKALGDNLVSAEFQGASALGANFAEVAKLYAPILEK